MTPGMIHLGRMGANMAERSVRGGHRVVGYDPNPEARERVEAEGAGSAASLEALVATLEAPRTLWPGERLCTTQRVLVVVPTGAS